MCCSLKSYFPLGNGKKNWLVFFKTLISMHKQTLYVRTRKDKEKVDGVAEYIWGFSDRFSSYKNPEKRRYEN